jgi:hypothetical protein
VDFRPIQLLGFLAALEGLYLLRTRFFGVSLLLLLPGSLVSFPLSTLGHTGTHWPIWTVYLNAVIGNVFVFAIVPSVVAGIRKSK